MKIKSFLVADEQESRIGSRRWSVTRLFELSRALDVMDIPLMHLNINYTYECLNLRDMVMHMNAVNSADLSYPIILDENGDVMDGRHRIIKALLIGAETIKAVRFIENPAPCSEDDE